MAGLLLFDPWTFHLVFLLLLLLFFRPLSEVAAHNNVRRACPMTGALVFIQTSIFRSRDTRGNARVRERANSQLLDPVAKIQ